jgi:hypothetical protein
LFVFNNIWDGPLIWRIVLLPSAGLGPGLLFFGPWPGWLGASHWAAPCETYCFVVHLGPSACGRIAFCVPLGASGSPAWQLHWRAASGFYLSDHNPAGWVSRTGLRGAMVIVLLYIWDHPLVGECAFCLPLGASGLGPGRRDFRLFRAAGRIPADSGSVAWQLPPRT